MDSITQSGLASINQAYNLASQSAQNIASATTNAESVTTEQSSYSAQPVAVTEAAINLAVAEQQSKVGANVLQTADDVLGTLIDTTV